jgi:polysaccharide export outer membrane protein
MKRNDHHWAAVFLPALFLAGALSLAAQTEPPAADASAVNPGGPPNSRNTVIGPDDTVTIVATNADEISKAWRVGASGYLNLPMVGRIQAAGMTVEQLEAELLSKLKRYIIDPQVIAYVSEFRSEPVTVTGAVEKPGITQMQGAKGLFDVLMRAGGPKNAGNRVTVTRRLEHGRIDYPGAADQDDSSVATLQLTEIMEGRGPAADLPIRPGDIISVSDVKERQKRVYILGEVNKPGMVELVTQDSVSLLKVLAVAGGFTRTASPKHAFVRHPDSKEPGREMSHVNLKKMLAGKSPDMKLNAGDIVVVPPSRVMTYISAASQSALTTGIYAVLARF